MYNPEYALFVTRRICIYLRLQTEISTWLRKKHQKDAQESLDQIFDDENEKSSRVLSLCQTQTRERPQHSRRMTAYFQDYVLLMQLDGGE